MAHRFFLFWLWIWPALTTAETPTLRLNELLAINGDGYSDEYEETDDWVEIINYGADPIDIGGLYLTDDLDQPTKWRIPESSPQITTVNAHDFILLWCDGQPEQGVLHTGWRLSGKGEEIGLFDRDGITPIDTLRFGRQQADVSMGRLISNQGVWEYFAEPTPNTPNRPVSFAGLTEKPNFSADGGSYNVPLSLDLSAAAAQIYYTLDGSDPFAADSLRYDGPIAINQTRIVRAVSYVPGYLPSPIATRTFLMGIKHQVPVVSLVTDPANLWDDDHGIYTAGSRIKPEDEWPYSRANFWRAWRRPAHLEYFDGNAGGFAAEVEIAVGGHRQTRPTLKKSLTVDVVGAQGRSEIEYALFEDGADQRFSRLILRSGGDWTRLKNEWLFALNETMGRPVDIQSYRPVVLMLNGAYWGLYNLMERKGEEFVERHHGATEVDILKWNAELKAGSKEHYLGMLEFLNTRDITLEQNYAHLRSLMEVENFIDYWVYMTFIARPHNSANIAYWRPRTADGRWRWIAYDVDTWHHANDPTLDQLLIEPTAQGWQLLGRLLQNKRFRHDFINRFADFLNSALLPEHTVLLMRQLSAEIKPEISADLARWGQWYDQWEYLYKDGKPEQQYGLWDWEERVEHMIDFLKDRPAILRRHLAETFDLSGEVVVSLQAEPMDGGSISISTLHVEAFPWSGRYFQGVPLELSALPRPGYSFVGWSDADLGPSDEAVLHPLDDLEITAHFAPLEIDLLVINEINYHASQELNSGDWVELYNPRDNDIDLSQWRFVDETNAFVLPQGASIKKGGYLILCENAQRFRTIFPQQDCLGDWDFRLNNSGEDISLYDAERNLIDLVSYDDQPPWPTATDGLGPTLELKDIEMDNNVGESWAASDGVGTPARPNSKARIDTFLEEPSVLPANPQLLQNFPNPFNTDTLIRYQIATAGQVHLEVYNLSGQRVRVLTDELLDTGLYQTRWDGRNDSGQAAASGVYFYRLRTPNFYQMRKMVLLK